MIIRYKVVSANVDQKKIAEYFNENMDSDLVLTVQKVCKITNEAF